jgi:hypothetical protein
MYMKSFADELTKIATAGTVALESANPLFKYWKPLAAMTGGALGFRELQKAKQKYDIGDQYYAQRGG